MKVLIAGAGIGGLCLAQGLKKAGIAFKVFERDPSAHFRDQGYRFRIDPNGGEALRQCLPDDLFALYQSTSNKPTHPPIGAYDYQMNLVYKIPGVQSVQPAVHTAVNRLTLRQVLLRGLEDEVQFGMEVAGVDQDSSSASLTFSNGQVEPGDLVVAADGSHSAIRKALLPEAEPLDLKITCIYGKIPLTPELLAFMPKELHAGFTPFLGPNFTTLAFGMFQMREPSDLVDPVPDYLMWVLVFPTVSMPKTPSEIHAYALSRMEGWHPDLKRLVEAADISATFPIPIRTSQRIEAWPSTRVTFLGDAIHLMTPAGGMGANTAMRDSALLTSQLVKVTNGEASLQEAIGEYESEMRDYGFEAVEKSLQSGSNLYQFKAVTK